MREVQPVGTVSVFQKAMIGLVGRRDGRLNIEDGRREDKHLTTERERHQLVSVPFPL